MVVAGIVIGVIMFAALFALLRESYRAAQENPRLSAPVAHEHVVASDTGECLLCRAPLPHVGTPDEAVSEIERGIESDRKAALGLAMRMAGGLPRFDP